MKINKEAQIFLTWCYKQIRGHNYINVNMILDHFNYTIGEYKMIINYLRDLKYITIIWMMESVSGYQTFLHLDITPLGIVEVEK